jgi:hypothetical protein
MICVRVLARSAYSQSARDRSRYGAPLPEVDRVPDVMIRRWIAVPRRPREQTRVDVELEQRIVVSWQATPIDSRSATN